MSDHETDTVTAAGSVDERRSISRHRAVARGDLIDRYVVLEEIGAGGVGVVLQAYDPELDRRVALKLLHAGSAKVGSDPRALLTREGQAIARLSHPNVVAVHDIGSHRGEVFIAMEYVAGHSLKEWMDTERSWQDTVRVFVQAGRGLAAAHAAGIVHRDFKPSNALIGDDGRVRVLDFGLARAFERAADDDGAAADDDVSSEDDGHRILSRTLTMTGPTAGTPAYMSPEQFAGRMPDARSDVFSFCAALYEALTGRLPFAGDDVASLRANVLAGKRRAIPDVVGLPRWLRELLARGLATEPDDRYPTMDQLLAELDADRRRGAAPWVTGGLVIGAVAFAVALGLMRDGDEPMCRTAPDRVAAVWNDDVAAAVTRRFVDTNRPYAAAVAGQVNELLSAYTDEWAAMHTATCEATEVRHEQSGPLMDLRMACLDRRLGGVAALVELFATDADAEVVDRAVPAVLDLPPLSVCEDAEALTARVPPPDDPEARDRIAEVRRTLAAAEAERRAGRYTAGLALATSADEAAAAIDDHGIRAETAYALGQLSDLGGDPTAGEQHVARAADEAALAHDDRIIAQSLIQLVSIVGVKHNRHAEALELHRAAAVAAARAGGDPELLALLYDNTARVHFARAEHTEAKALYERELEIAREAFGENHPTVGRALDGIGNTLVEMGKFSEALEVTERALANTEAVYGKDHVLTANTLNNLGDTYKQLGQYDKAAEIGERALAIERAALGDDHPGLIEGYTNVAVAYYNLGRLDEAYDLHRRALALAEKSYAPGHQTISGAHQNVGLLAQTRGDVDEARRHLEASIENTTLGFGDEHPDLAYPLLSIAQLSRDAGDPAGALPYCERALAIRRKALGDAHPLTAFSLKEMAPALIGVGRLGDAIDALEESLAVWVTLPYHGTTADVRVLLARTLWDAGRDRARARRLVGEAIDAYVELAPQKDAQLAEARAWLAARGG